MSGAVLETAELIKYASNAFLATKITFINQMANLADAVGADIHQVARTMGMDGRISPKFLHPGPGYGGSCFPKDTRAVVSTGDEYGVDMSLIRMVIQANEEQKKRVVSVLKEMAGDLEGLVVAVLGLSFKSETDDVRDSPSLTVVADLSGAGAARSGPTIPKGVKISGNSSRKPLVFPLPMRPWKVPMP